MARRLRAQKIVRWAALAWVVFAIGGLGLGIVRLLGGGPPFTWEIGGVVLGAWMLVVAASTVGTRRPLVDAARVVDEAAGGADRMTTAVRLRAGTRWQGLVVADAKAFSRTHPAKEIVRIQWKPVVAVLFVPLLLGVGLTWLFEARAASSAAEREVVAKILEDAAEVVGDPDGEELAETERELRSQAAALRERLSPKPREDALRALAAASADIDRLRGDRESTNAGSGREEASGAGSGEDLPVVGENAARSNDPAGGAGRALSEEELADMASRMEEMKRAVRGEPSPGQTEGGSGSAGDALAQLEAAAQTGKDGASAGQRSSERPGGGPGDERDIGRGGPLLGAATEIESNGLDDRSGLDRGMGAAVAVGTISTDGGGRAERPYREAYGEARRVAEDSIKREELPHGSRELVRRYFERIAPPK